MIYLFITINAKEGAWRECLPLTHILTNNIYKVTNRETHKISIVLIQYTTEQLYIMPKL